MLSPGLDAILSQTYQFAGQIKLVNDSTDEERDNLQTLARNGYLKAIAIGSYVLLPKGLQYVEANTLADKTLIARNKKIREGLKLVERRLQEGNPQFEQLWRNQMIGEGIDNATINVVQNYMLLAGLL